MGFTRPQDALGKDLEWNNNSYPIVGVIGNMYTHPLNITEFTAGPLVLTEPTGSCQKIMIDLPPAAHGESSWQTTIARMTAVYKAAYPGEEFNYTFFDEDLAAFYQNEKQLSGLLAWATAIATVISCLGLLGLVIYTTQQRTKEIGVRKVFGASITNIVFLLSVEFIWLVALAFLIAAPVAWWGIHRWLENFVTRTAIVWWVFGLSGMGMLLIATVTLGAQAIRTAMVSPAKTLRTE